MPDDDRFALGLDVDPFDVTDFTGPFETFTRADGASFPWYLLRFDKTGRMQSPQALASLLQDLEGGRFTDVFVFSHGWNNDWPAAQTRYRTFIENMVRLRGDYPPSADRPIRPLLIGVIWPSTSWMLPWEKGPRIAAAPASTFDDVQDEALRELVASPSLDAEGARRLARLLVDDEGLDGDGTWEDFLTAWRSLDAERVELDGGEEGTALFDEGGFIADGESGDTDDRRTDPSAADLGKLDPRGALRAVTVWKMKDRAGKVGAHGLAPVLEKVLASGPAHVHLIGHSFGAKVVCDAVAAAELGSERRVRSMLLLQPAVSAWCFAAEMPRERGDEPEEGGYRQVLDRVELPILTTFSRQDVPLRRVFHLALRRRHDLGEITAAAAVPRWAALGGFGPQGLPSNELAEIEIPPPGEPLPLDTSVEVLALQGHARIGGHGDVVSELTAWALWSLVNFRDS